MCAGASYPESFLQHTVNTHLPPFVPGSAEWQAMPTQPAPDNGLSASDALTLQVRPR